MRDAPVGIRSTVLVHVLGSRGVWVGVLRGGIVTTWEPEPNTKLEMFSLYAMLAFLFVTGVAMAAGC